MAAAVGKREVVFLCTERELDRERAGMWEALQGLATVRVLPSRLGSAAAILDWWQAQGPRAERPVLLWPDPHDSYLPDGLNSCGALTACWHIDSFSVSELRAEHARLFDVTFVFHPDSVAQFHEFGVSDVHLLPHAVRRRFFSGPAPERVWDVAFVGSLKGAYSYRRACLAELVADGHLMNDYARAYAYADLAGIYRRARIGVNVPQDHYLRDANLRCFEVMAAGALLLTPAGSELRSLGFVPGRHYLEFGSAAELRRIARRMLEAESERAAIAGAAQHKTLAEFTYDQAAMRMLAALDAAGARPTGARVPEAAEHRICMRYFARRGRVREAARHFVGLAATGAIGGGDARDLLAGFARGARAGLRGLIRR